MNPTNTFTRFDSKSKPRKPNPKNKNSNFSPKKPKSSQTPLMASSSSSIDPKPQPQNPTPTPNPQTPTLNPTPKTLTPSPQIHKFPQQQQSSQTYPYSSSTNRNYGPKPSSSSYRPQSSEQFVNSSSSGFNGRNGGQFPNQMRNFGNSPQSMRPPPASQFGARFPGSGGGGGGPIRSSPVVANHNHNHNHKTPYQSPATGNGYRDSRETNRDDSVVTIHHRKVRLSDGGSLYALCRSWVRNGLPKETKPPPGEGLKLLPRPLPISVANGGLPEKSGSDDEDEEKEEEVSSVENMSARELLHLHVKSAKKTRARLRKERLQKIDRFKQRLALLLPPPEEQVRERDAGETF